MTGCKSVSFLRRTLLLVLLLLLLLLLLFTFTHVFIHLKNTWAARAQSVLIHLRNLQVEGTPTTPTTPNHTPNLTFQTNAAYIMRISISTHLQNPVCFYVEIKCQLDATEVFIADLIACSTCFGHHYAHYQELKSFIQWLLPVVFRAVVFQVAGLVWS